MVISVTMVSQAQIQNHDMKLLTINDQQSAINRQLATAIIRTVFGRRLKVDSRQLRKGFTLIELLVVIAIIGILASVLLVNFIGVRQRARDAQRKTQIKQIQSAFEVYRSDKGQYPCLPGGCTENDADTIDKLTATLGSYLSDEVKDPLYSSTCPNYLVSSTGSQYTIYAKLENSNDADATADKKAPNANAGTTFQCLNGSDASHCKQYSTTRGCSATYDYWVNNP